MNENLAAVGYEGKVREFSLDTLMQKTTTWRTLVSISGKLEIRDCSHLS